MKGLLIKDIKLILKNKLFLIGTILVAFILVTTTGNNSFLLGYVTLLCTMLVITTMSYDEQNKTLAFLMTLPTTRKEYVWEKYILMYCCAFTGVVFSSMICTVSDRGLGAELLLTAVSIFVTIVLLQLIMMPLQFKFGGEKSRLVLVLMFACFAGIAIIVSKSGESGVAQFLYKAVEWFFSLKGWMSAALIVIFILCCTAVSVLISTRIIRRKEF